MRYRVVWTKRAMKQLLAIPKRQRLMVAAWVRDNLDGCENPKALECAKKIQGTDQGWCFRMGSYRVLARIRESEVLIEIVRVGHRQGVYGHIPDL